MVRGYNSVNPMTREETVMRKFSTAASVGVMATVAVIGIGGTATAAHLIGSKDIKNNSVRSVDLRDGTIKISDLNATTISELRAAAGKDGKDGTNGTDGKDGVDGKDATLAANSTSDPAIVQNIGGSFGKFTGTVRATKVDEVSLPAGTYQLTADGFFHSTAATSGLTRMQLAVRVDDGTDWGKDLGTCFTDATSPLANREATCSSTRVVTLDAPTTVQVFAFGYADDQGSFDSGKFAAVSYLSAIKLAS